MNALQQNIWGMYSSVFTTMFRSMSPKSINKNTNFTKLQTAKFQSDRDHNTQWVQSLHEHG